jgi:hypothetical protein
MNRNIVAKGIEYDKLYFDRAELAVQQSGFADRVSTLIRLIFSCVFR